MENTEALTDEQKVLLWEACRKDISFYAKHVLGVEQIEDYQDELFKAVMENERVVVRSCHNMGKTWGAGVIVLWFTPNHPQSKMVSTAPTSRQVRLLLWGEIGAGYRTSLYPLGGNLTTTEWKINSDWWAIGFTTQKEAAGGRGQANSGFQGIHAPYVLVIFDEATGIAPDIWKQLEGLLTSANVRFVAFGNPTTKACEFYKCFSDPTYKKIHLSCFQSPNLIANKITDLKKLTAEYNLLRELEEREALKRLDSYQVVRPHLLTTKWVMGSALKWGLDHPLFVSKALGDFPDEDENSLMPLGVVEAAQRRVHKERPKEKFYIGIDPARMGRDKSVITRMKGAAVKEAQVKTKRLTTELSGAVIAMVNGFPEAERDVGGVITVDATGIGSGVLDELREYKRLHRLKWRNVEMKEVHNVETFKVDRDGDEEQVKKRNELYANKKAEMFMLLAQDVKTEVSLPANISEYEEELPTIIYSFTSKGQYIIEDKDEYKHRTGMGSPDHSDSLALANYGRHYGATQGVGTFTRSMIPPARRRIAGT